MQTQTYHEELKPYLTQNLPWEKLSGKTVLISGATGMIGKCIIDILMAYNSEQNNSDKRVSIVALSRNLEAASKRLASYWENENLRYLSADVNNTIPECGNVDYIIHAASNTHPRQYSQDSIGTITSNVIGTKNLLDYAAAHKIDRFCFVSSVEIYGENRGDTESFSEDYLGYINCNTLRAGYPESKRLGEALCNAYYQTYQMDFVIPRLSRAYGPTMLPSDSKAIAQFIKKAAAGEDIVLKSAGTQLYSYTYALDAAMGILMVLLKGKKGEAYNISDPESEVTLKQITEWLAEDNGVKVIFEIPDAAEQAGYSTATKALLDIDKISELGWKPLVHMREGLVRTVKSLT
ncbi:MAG: NAD-dependent epimerase/dehydratase family protein [Lachnospiraceae bacterium]|nr:NAD-dependent epimerase/dehydratase family protein [Lachnospiraceae bacterium]